MYRKRNLNYEELAGIIMEVKKSPKLPSASWRPRETGGLASVLEAWEWGASGVSPIPSPKVWEPEALMSEGGRIWMSQLKQRE